MIEQRPESPARLRTSPSPPARPERKPAHILGAAAIVSSLLFCFPALTVAADVQLAWDPNQEADLAGYKLYYGTASRTYSTIVSLGKVTTATVPNLGPGTWYFAVTAVNTAGLESGFSNEVSANIAGGNASDTTAPILSDIRSEGATSTTVTILWTTNEPASSEVEYGPSSSFGFKTADVALGLQHTVVLQGLVSGTTYSYRVISADTAGNRAVSAERVFKTSGQTPPTTDAAASWYPGVGAVNRSSTPDIVHTGIAVTNFGSTPAVVKFSAVGSDGGLVSGASLNNPALRTLNPGQQLPIVDTELFGNDLLKVPNPGAFRIEATGGQLAATFMLFNERLSLLDGAIVTAPPTTSCVFPEVETRGYTRMTLSNPEPDPAVIGLELRRGDGSVRGTAARTLPAGGSLTVDLFADVFPQFAPDATDYLVAQSTKRFTPFEVLGQNGGDVKILRGLDPGAGAARLYSPQYVVGGGWRTTLSLVNLDDMAGSITLTLRGDYGALLGASRVIQIPARGKAVVDDPAFFVSSTGAPVQGYLEIASSGPRITGSVSFGNDQANRSTTALPLVSDLGSTQVFGQVASNDLYFTGIAVLNPSGSSAGVTVEAYDAAGGLRFRRTLTVPSLGRFSQLLTQLFPGISGQSWSSGYIRVFSDTPVAAFALIGARDLSVLSAIPGSTGR